MDQLAWLWSVMLKMLNCSKNKCPWTPKGLEKELVYQGRPPPFFLVSSPQVTG